MRVEFVDENGEGISVHDSVEMIPFVVGDVIRLEVHKHREKPFSGDFKIMYIKHRWCKYLPSKNSSLGASTTEAVVVTLRKN